MAEMYNRPIHIYSYSTGIPMCPLCLSLSQWHFGDAINLNQPEGWDLVIFWDAEAKLWGILACHICRTHQYFPWELRN
jgi:hypothetical protein